MPLISYSQTTNLSLPSIKLIIYTSSYIPCEFKDISPIYYNLNLSKCPHVSTYFHILSTIKILLFHEDFSSRRIPLSRYKIVKKIRNHKMLWPLRLQSSPATRCYTQQISRRNRHIALCYIPRDSPAYCVTSPCIIFLLYYIILYPLLRRIVMSASSMFPDRSDQSITSDSPASQNPRLNVPARFSICIRIISTKYCALS